MEKVTPLEAGNRIAVTAVRAGHFLVDRLLGGGWDRLPSTATREPKPPVKARITYITTGENNENQSAA